MNTPEIDFSFKLLSPFRDFKLGAYDLNEAALAHKYTAQKLIKAKGEADSASSILHELGLGGQDDMDIIEQYINPRPIIEIESKSGNYTISDTDILKLTLDCHVEEWVEVSMEGHYLVISVRWACGQGAALGIWNCAERKWFFKEFGDHFGVDKLIYLPKLKQFLGFYDINTYGWGAAGLVFIDIDSAEFKRVSSHVNHNFDYSDPIKKGEKTSEIIVKNKDIEVYPGTTGWREVSYYEQPFFMSYDEDKHLFCSKGLNEEVYEVNWEALKTESF